MATLYYESQICHHGIKGQKWGVRRYQNEDGTLTSAGKKKLLKRLKNPKTDFDEFKSGLTKAVDMMYESKFQKEMKNVDAAVDTYENASKPLDEFYRNKNTLKNYLRKVEADLLASDDEYYKSIGEYHDYDHEKILNMNVERDLKFKKFRDAEERYCRDRGISYSEIEDGRKKAISDFEKASVNLTNVMMREYGVKPFKSIDDEQFLINEELEDRKFRRG